MMDADTESGVWRKVSPQLLALANFGYAWLALSLALTGAFEEVVAFLLIATGCLTVFSGILILCGCSKHQLHRVEFGVACIFAILSASILYWEFTGFMLKGGYFFGIVAFVMLTGGSAKV